MKTIKVTEALGTILCHDITKIVPGEFKGVAFKKGHVIKEEDIPVLLSLGKEHLFVWEDTPGILHENDAALRLRDLTGGDNLYYGDIKEGKIEFFANIDGLLKIDVEALNTLNSFGEIILSTLLTNTVVKMGDKVAATKIVPLFMEEDKMKRLEETIKNKIVHIIPIHNKKTALITTGSEVYYGRIKDASLPTLQEKLKPYECEIIGQNIVPDDMIQIEQAIHAWVERGAELIICTGGMSVDPDDVTKTAIKNTGATIITYGTPVLPGAMFILAYKNNIPILGVPANVIFSKRTVLDILLPRVLADDQISFSDIAAYGHGGLL